MTNKANEIENLKNIINHWLKHYKPTEQIVDYLAHAIMEDNYIIPKTDSPEKHVEITRNEYADIKLKWREDK